MRIVLNENMKTNPGNGHFIQVPVYIIYCSIILTVIFIHRIFSVLICEIVVFYHYAPLIQLYIIHFKGYHLLK